MLMYNFGKTPTPIYNYSFIHNRATRKGFYRITLHFIEVKLAFVDLAISIYLLKIYFTKCIKEYTNYKF